jgi:quinol monooxygenase YgiN
MSEGVIIVTIKLKPDASRDRFLELCREVRTWLARQPGFVRYELFEADDGRWTDIMTWASVEEMEVGHKALGTSDLTNAFDDLVEPEHVSFVGKAVAL